MKQYLEDLTPQEVIDRMTKGEQVHYTDSKGNEYLYVLYKGVTIRIDKSTGKCDGFNRSIYSTCGAYFNVEDSVEVKVGKHYKTRDGHVVFIESKGSKWYRGYVFKESNEFHCWLKDGSFFEDGTASSTDLVEEL